MTAHIRRIIQPRMAGLKTGEWTTSWPAPGEHKTEQIRAHGDHEDSPKNQKAKNI